MTPALQLVAQRGDVLVRILAPDKEDPRLLDRGEDPQFTCCRSVAPTPTTPSPT